MSLNISEMEMEADESAQDSARLPSVVPTSNMESTERPEEDNSTSQRLGDWLADVQNSPDAQE
jgi:hypothetical protein